MAAASRITPLACFTQDIPFNGFNYMTRYCASELRKLTYLDSGATEAGSYGSHEVFHQYRLYNSSLKIHTSEYLDRQLAPSMNNQHKYLHVLTNELHSRNYRKIDN